MTIKKGQMDWPREYESPQLIHIQTAYQQALGVSYCSPLGNNAGGGSGSCSTGSSASGTPTDPNACSAGNSATVGPGNGNSPCGPGSGARA
ncbi:MAG: hypothetical protein AB1724_08095 [Thermodesulfobacteriota bacterium]